MELNSLPIIKGSINTERITLAITPEMKRQLAQLKQERKVDTGELVRMAIKSVLDSVTEEVATV